MLRVPSYQWLCILLLVIVAPDAHAESVQSRRETFERARTHIEAEQWQQARVLLLSLWRERPTYDVALQLGQVEFNLGDFRDAAEHLAYGLANLPPREHLATAARSRQILALCRERVGSLTLQVDTKGADVFVDETCIGTTPLTTDVFLNPGRHRFEVRLPGHPIETWAMHFGPGQVTSRNVKLTPTTSVATNGSGSNPTSSTAPLATDAQRDTPRRASVVPIIAGSVVALAGISTGIVMQFLRSSRNDEAAQIRGQIGPGACAARGEHQYECDRLVALSADYDSFGRIELLSFLVGGAAFVGTGAYFLTTRPSPTPTTARSTNTPITWNLSLTPHQSRFDFAVPF